MRFTDVKCPRCDAEPGRPCVNVSGPNKGRAQVKQHPWRVNLARFATTLVNGEWEKNTKKAVHTLADGQKVYYPSIHDVVVTEMNR